MQTVLDFTAAVSARDEAIARVDEHAEPGWKEKAMEAVRLVCESRTHFIADDIWSVGLERPSEARALGAVIQQAARAGLCEPTNEFRHSAQPQCHANPRRVWRSLLAA